MRPKVLLSLLSLTVFGHASAVARYPLYAEAAYYCGQIIHDTQGGPLLTLTNGVDFDYQNSDSNFVAYRTGVSRLEYEDP